jgi:hypothetical protein
MTRRMMNVDRIVVLLTGIALVVTGALLAEWQLGLRLDLGDRLTLGSLADLAESGVWPVVTAVAAVVLVAVGLRWVLGHLPRPQAGDRRLGSSEPSGTLTVDSGSVAKAAASALRSEALLPETSGHVRGGLIEVEARCSRHADIERLRSWVAQTSRDLDRAFPRGELALRVLVDAPRRRAPLRKVFTSRTIIVEDPLRGTSAPATAPSAGRP